MHGFEIFIEWQNIHESGGNSKNRRFGYTNLIHWKSYALNNENCNYSLTLSLCNSLIYYL